MAHLRTIAAALAAMLTGAGLVEAGPMPVSPVEVPSFVVSVASCQQIAQQVAAQQGGRVSDAQEQNRNGQRVCVVVVEAKGKRAQRVTVPMN